MVTFTNCRAMTEVRADLNNANMGGRLRVNTARANGPLRGTVVVVDSSDPSDRYYAEVVEDVLVDEGVVLLADVRLGERAWSALRIA